MKNSLNCHQNLVPEEARAVLGSKRYGEICKHLFEIHNSALGIPYPAIGKEESKYLFFRRSLFVVKDMRKEEEFSEENLRSIRPHYGLHPRYLKDILGKRVAQDIERGTPLSWGLLNRLG